MSHLKEIEKDVSAAIAAANDIKALEETRVAALGKSGSVTGLLKTISTLPVEERKSFGQEVNVLKNRLAEAIEERAQILKLADLNKRLETETVDISLPIYERGQGTLHPITQTTDEMIAIFADMGFDVVTGPDLENDFHNFTALNFPANHPARQMHDTFYITPEQEGVEPKLLRTHTSTVQIRHMLENKPPIKIIVPGRVYRSDYDMTHTPMFHQVEGLVIDKTTHMGHLKGCLTDFLRAFFNLDDLPVRFRPHYFPFTEPSAEVDIGYSRNDGGLKIGAGDQWMEILGCGMVHPNVIRNCGLDPDEYQGFAFGMGVDRLAMLKFGIPDLRTFFDPDIRWLKHYGFSIFEQPNRALGD